MVGAHRRRVSKNKKKNWKKHSNIDDVEQYLDDVRLQERTGGLVSAKEDHQLFMIDKCKNGKVLSEGEIRAVRKLPKALKCHSSLMPDSSIEPIMQKRQMKKPDPKREEEARKKKEKRRALSGAKNSGDTNRNTFYDLWGDDVLRDKDSSAVDEIDGGHFSTVTKRRRVKLRPKLLEKPSNKPAVEVPAPGMSYNPTFDDHQRLLEEALEVEIDKEKKELKIKRALDEMFPKKADAPTEASYLKEMSAGLEGFESDSDPEDPQGGEDGIADQMPVASRHIERKTKSQRNRERRQREFEELKRKEKERKVKEREFYRLKSIKKELKAEAAKSERRQFRRAIRKRQKQEGTLRLARTKYEDPEIPLKLSDELQGSLRLLTPESHILEDRYKSLQKRNYIPPRNKQKTNRKPKIKPKKYEKRGHKEITL